MRLIKSLEMRKSKTGNSYHSWGLFRCPSCKRKVEKQLGHGKRDMSCGCAHSENLSKALKGRLGLKGKNHPSWRGGETKDSYGYILIHQPSHHRADNHGYSKRDRKSVV